MSKHTPEPWHAGHLHDEKHPCNCRYVYGNDGRMGAVASVHVSADDESDDPPLVEAMANQIRIVQCVNAMAGVADPALFMEMFKDYAKTEIHSGKNFGGCGELYTTAMKLLNGRVNAPATTDDWREKCTVDKGLNNEWNVHSADDKYYLGDGTRFGWVDNGQHTHRKLSERYGIFDTEESARAALARAPKPPAGETK